MKKIVSLLMILVFCFIISGANVSAASVPLLSVSSTSGHIGDEITVDISISNNPGLGFFQIDLLYDNTKLQAMQGGIITNKAYSNITSNLEDPKVNLNDLEEVTAIWYNEKFEDNTEDGILYSVKFKIIGSSSDGIALSLNINKGNIADMNFKVQENLRFYDGIVTVLAEGESSGAVSVNKGISAYMVEENVCRATVTNDDEDVTEGMLLAAIYDKETNRMIEAAVCEVTVSNGQLTKRLPFETYDPETQYIKLFLWDLNMESMCMPGEVY